MEPCTDSSEEDDLKLFQNKFKKKTNKLVKSRNSDNTDYVQTIQKDNINSKSTTHKHFDKQGNKLSSYDDDDDDNEEEKEEEDYDEDENDEEEDNDEEDNDKDEDDNDEDYDDNDEDDEMTEEQQYIKSKKSVLDSSEDEDESINDESETDPYGTVRKELLVMSFEDRQKLKNKLGSKIYNKIVLGDKPSSDSKHSEIDSTYKNRPLEVTAKKRVPRFRKVVEVKRKLNRDPRFDDLSGEFDEKKFKQTYSFIEEMQQKERKKVLKEMKREKDKTRKSELKSLANRYKQLEESNKKKEKKSGLLNQWKKKEQELVKDGKTPYFLKQSDIKKLELADKYRELKEKGALDKYMAKRRKKNSAKEKKKLYM